ncbi:MAG: nucleotidyl transferase AbiEii/AbiGii toxin family protein [Planctomycetia bacterium]|nr:nucleotidyl transferase AbiEii/AbiGii toxin family protein [Planctomycetia bacterium]
MIEVYRAAAGLQQRFQEQGWRFCLIGGLALQRWGEPRETIDVDVTLLTGFGGEESFVREILDWYEPRVADPAGFALENRVLLVQAASGVGIDIALGGMPFEESAVARATPYEFAPGIPLQTASSEDLIVMKAFASRPKDWVDLEGILIRQHGRLDWAYVESQLQPLAELKEEPEILERLANMRNKV